MLIEISDLPPQSDTATLDEQIYLFDEETGEPVDYTDFTFTVVVREMLNEGSFGNIAFQGSEDDGQIIFPNGKDGGFLQLYFEPAEIYVCRTGRYAYIITGVDDTTTETVEIVSHGTIRKVVP